MKNKKEKTCITCGRMIIDKNNKTGFCPSCAEKGEGVAVLAGSVGAVVLIKKYGKSIVKGAVELAKAIIKR